MGEYCCIQMHNAQLQPAASVVLTSGDRSDRSLLVTLWLQQSLPLQVVSMLWCLWQASLQRQGVASCLGLSLTDYPHGGGRVLSSGFLTFQSLPAATSFLVLTSSSTCKIPLSVAHDVIMVKALGSLVGEA